MTGRKTQSVHRVYWQGNSGSTRFGTSLVKTSEDDYNWIITVEDDGVGFDQKKDPDDERFHVGLSNVKEKLRIMCKGSVEIDSKVDEGTKVTLKLPKSEVSIK